MLQTLPRLLRSRLPSWHCQTVSRALIRRTSPPSHSLPSPLSPSGIRTLHTSASRHAAFFMAPLARLLAAVTGRLARRWWQQLTPEKRKAVKEAIMRRRGLLYGGAGFLSLGGIGYYWSHLESTPITGRRRFMMFSHSRLLDLIESEKVVLMQALSLGQEFLPPSHPTYKYILSIIAAIIGKNWRREFEGINWELHVIDSPDTVNAVCLPSGAIFVYTGLLKAMHNDEELAFILGHEIAHAVLGHGAEQLSHRGIIDFFSLMLIGVIWAVVPNDLVSYFLHGWSRTTAEVMLEYPYSRQLETEADEVGLMFAATACYDPGKAAKVWTHLPTFNEKDRVVEYLSTHPCNERRYETLQTLLPSAYSLWQSNTCEGTRKEMESFQKRVSNMLKRVKIW